MTTKILLIRHAKPESYNLFEDDKRPLSAEGRLIQRKMSELLKAKGFFPDAIFHSPILRAKETAEVIAEVFAAELQEIEDLGFEFDPQTLLELIPDPQENKTIFMVSHSPTLVHFANLLTKSKEVPQDIEKSGVMILEFQEPVAFGKAKFVHYLSPAKIS